jgi:hypothetical protein
MLPLSFIFCPTLFAGCLLYDAVLTAQIPFNAAAAMAMGAAAGLGTCKKCYNAKAPGNYGFCVLHRQPGQ